VPVNMISLHMQGGCLCENPPGLRLDTNNVELAATIVRARVAVSPRPAEARRPPRTVCCLTRASSTARGG